MNDDYVIGTDDPIHWADVRMAADNYWASKGEGIESRQTHRGYLHRLIVQCYEQGDVTREELADASYYTVGTIDRIRRSARPPHPRPKLRVVRSAEEIAAWRNGG